jgi:hypothetical protein
MKKYLFLLFLYSAVCFAQGQRIQKANFPGTISSGTGFVIGQEGYLGMGWNPFETKLFYRYNPTVNSWTPIANFSGPFLGAPVGFSIGNKELPERA